MTTQDSPINPIPPSDRRRMSDRTVLLIVLVIGLVNGLIYTFLLPPWQHHDEPNHYEAAALIVRLGRMFRPGDADEQLNRQVTDSMVRNKFFGDAPPPDFTYYDGRSYIPGFNQLDEPPLYYWLAALPLRLLQGQELEIQLRAARMLGLLFYLLTLICAWGITRELTRPTNPLRWMTPLSIALLPPFTDIMTALNNDAAAVGLMSLFLWGAVRLIQRGFSLLDFLWASAAALLCYFTKSTAYFSLILLPVAVLFSILRGRWRWLAWAALALAGILVVALAFKWDDPARWARSTFQVQPIRVETPSAPLGEHAFQLELEPGIDPNSNVARFYQAHQILDAAPKDLREKYITVGAWMWASRPVKAYLPFFRSVGGQVSATKDVWITETPTFYAYKTRVEGGAGRNWITLSPLVETLEEPVTVYFDGVVAAESRLPTDQVPVFDDASGATGTWGGKSFKNLLRNGSGEKTWLRLDPRLDELGMRFLPDYTFNIPSISLYYLLDLPATWRSHFAIVKFLFQTYWGRFGWGHVRLIHAWAYPLLLAVTLAGLLGAVYGIWRRRRGLQWEMVGFMVLTVLPPWLLALVRTSNYALLMRPLFYPSARYAFPVIIFMMLALNLGWYEVGRLLNRWLRIPQVVLKWIYILSLAALNGYAILSIYNFYY